MTFNQPRRVIYPPATADFNWDSNPEKTAKWTQIKTIEYVRELLEKVDQLAVTVEACHMRIARLEDRIPTSFSGNDDGSPGEALSDMRTANWP